MGYVLYDFRSSGNGYKCRLTLKALRDPVRIPRAPSPPARRARPKVPRSTRTGRFRFPDRGPLAESHAIISYLADGTPLMPGDRFERALSGSGLASSRYQLEPGVGTVRFMLHYSARPGRSSACATRTASSAAPTRSPLEQGLTGRRWLVGDARTLADIGLFAYTHVADEAAIASRTIPRRSPRGSRSSLLPWYSPITAPEDGLMDDETARRMAALAGADPGQPGAATAQQREALRVPKSQFEIVRRQAERTERIQTGPRSCRRRARRRGRGPTLAGRDTARRRAARRVPELADLQVGNAAHAGRPSAWLKLGLISFGVGRADRDHVTSRAGRGAALVRRAHLSQRPQLRDHRPRARGSAARRLARWRLHGAWAARSPRSASCCRRSRYCSRCRTSTRCTATCRSSWPCSTA